MTGPFHHDFQIGTKEKTYGRLIFDLRIEQMVNFHIESVRSAIEFSKEYPGEKFNFIL